MQDSTPAYNGRVRRTLEAKMSKYYSNVYIMNNITVRRYDISSPISAAIASWRCNLMIILHTSTYKKQLFYNIN